MDGIKRRLGGGKDIFRMDSKQTSEVSKTSEVFCVEAGEKSLIGNPKRLFHATIAVISILRPPIENPRRLHVHHPA